MRRAEKENNRKEALLNPLVGGAYTGKNRNAFCHRTHRECHFCILNVHALLLCKGLAVIHCYEPARC